MVIKEIVYYKCGTCKNNLKNVFKKTKSEVVLFPAGVFLIKHKEGYVLYDTGYSKEIYHKSLKARLYNALNPVQLDEEDEIKYQLEKDGISCDAIKQVIISHLHPDHIGGLKFFNNAKFIISSKAYDTYKKPKFKDLIFNHFIPDDFEKRLQIIDSEKDYDLFADKSVILSVYDGHAKGQITVKMPNEKIFLASDICWGLTYIDKEKNMKLIPKLIQNNFGTYIEAIHSLKALVKEGYHVYPSHEQISEKHLK